MAEPKQNKTKQKDKIKTKLYNINVKVEKEEASVIQKRPIHFEPKESDREFARETDQIANEWESINEAVSSAQRYRCISATGR